MSGTVPVRASRWLLIGLAVPVACYAFLFQLGLVGAPDFQLRFGRMPLAAGLHVLGGGLALLIGGFQFLPGLRARHLGWHRWLGRTYLCAVLAGGLGGLALALEADGGLVGRFGFGLLAVVWLVTGWQAYGAVRAGDPAAHRVWMIRNFSLTFAAVTLRVYLGIASAAGISFEEFYPVVAWLCWVPNLIVAEWLIVATPPMALAPGGKRRDSLTPAPSSGVGPV